MRASLAIDLRSTRAPYSYLIIRRQDISFQKAAPQSASPATRVVTPVRPSICPPNCGTSPGLNTPHTATWLRAVSGEASARNRRHAPIGAFNFTQRDFRTMSADFTSTGCPLSDHMACSALETAESHGATERRSPHSRAHTLLANRTGISLIAACGCPTGRRFSLPLRS